MAALSPESFLEELDAANRTALERIATLSQRDAPQSCAAPEPAAEKLTVTKLLRMALKNEIEATECAAAWIATTPEIAVKLALARQAGDEAKHYRLIQKRLSELGVETAGHDPLSAGKSPLLTYLLG